MASSKSMFEGKNAVQQSAHIRSSKPTNGAGFNRQVLTNTQTQFSPGTPVRNGAHVDATVAKHYLADNPYNPMDRDEAKVLGPNVAGQNAGRYPDSPVPSSAQTPNIAITSKAGQVAASASISPNVPPGDGVLGRG